MRMFENGDVLHTAPAVVCYMCVLPQGCISGAVCTRSVSSTVLKYDLNTISLETFLGSEDTLNT